MKACVLTDWKKLEMKDVPSPVLVDGQVLIEVTYGGVCGSDINIFNHGHPTATVPRILCHEIMGTIKEIKCNDKLPYKVGDRVVVLPLTSCGVCDACRDGNFHVCKKLQINGVHKDGGFAQFFVAEADKVFPVPEILPDRVAILTEPFAVGFHANMRAGTQPGDSVFVIGAGPIGIVAAMTAKYFGAAQVVMTEVSPARRDMAREFGFVVLDPSEVDVVAEIMRITDGNGFDRVLEASGSQPGSDLITSAAKIRGTVVPIGIPATPRSYNIVKIILNELTLNGVRVYPRSEFMRTIIMVKDFYENKTFDLAKMIDSEFTLDETEAAMTRFASGENKGKVIVRIKE